MIAAAAAAATMAFAIVVGDNKPASEDVQTLQYADDDAAAMTEVLEETGAHVAFLTRYDDDTTRRMTRRPDGPATKKAFLASLQTMRAAAAAAKAAGAATTFYFVFSGHGGLRRTGEGYLMFEDGKLQRSELQEVLLGNPVADVNHVVIDACDSYFAVFAKGGHRQPLTRRLPLEPAPSFGFVLSTSTDREAHEWPRLQGGVFSVEVRAALRGAADVDGDGRTSYAELGAFLGSANVGVYGHFAPDPFLRAPAGSDVVIAWPTVGAAGPAAASPTSSDILTVDIPNVGHVFVEDGDGNRVVDVNAAPSWTPVVHIPASRPLFVHTVATNDERRVDERGPIVLSSLEPRRGPPPPKGGASDIQFEKLFSGALTPEDVTRWTPPPPPMEPGDPLLVGGVAGVGAGAAILLGATFSNLTAQNIHDEGFDKPNAERLERNKQIAALNAVTTVTVISGSAVVAAGVGSLLWREWSDVE